MFFLFTINCLRTSHTFFLTSTLKNKFFFNIPQSFKVSQLFNNKLLTKKLMIKKNIFIISNVDTTITKRNEREKMIKVRLK